MIDALEDFNHADSEHFAVQVSLPDPMIGYYSWNWSTGSTGPKGSNIGAAFTGYSDVTKAIEGYVEESSWCCPKLNQHNLITIGGGNEHGVMNAKYLK
jgi:hypothetical protein